MWVSGFWKVLEKICSSRIHFNLFESPAAKVWMSYRGRIDFETLNSHNRCSWESKDPIEAV